MLADYRIRDWCDDDSQAVATRVTADHARECLQRFDKTHEFGATDSENGRGHLAGQVGRGASVPRNPFVEQYQFAAAAGICEIVGTQDHGGPLA